MSTKPCLKPVLFGLRLILALAALFIAAAGSGQAAVEPSPGGANPLLIETPDAPVVSATPVIISPFPVEPPDMDKIAISEPNLEGYVTVTGAAGAVEANAPVALVNLNANNVMTATAAADGSFTAQMFAPPGSALLIKYERLIPGSWRRVELFWDDTRSTISDSTIDTIMELPGAIRYVGQPAVADDDSQPFYSVGANLSSETHGWAGWWISGTLETPADGLPGLSAQPGDTLTLNGRLRVTSPAMQCSGTPTYTVSIADAEIRYMFDAGGRALPWGSWFNAQLFTPTGLPIEIDTGGEILDTGASVTFSNPVCVSQHAFEGEVHSTFSLPVDLPNGTYRPGTIILLGGVPLSSGEALVRVWYRSAEVVAGLPSFRVGDAAAPRIPFTILGNTLLNGSRGVQAREDVGQHQMTPRPLYPPHQVVVPRLDERSGEPIVYQLEPYSIWMSSTDRRVPNPPTIPLALPTGQLTVEILKPNGSVDTLGPSPLRQTSVRTPATPGGAPLDSGTGHIGDLYQLRTMDETFAYTFDQYGPHNIALYGEVQDVYGNLYPIHSTYDIVVARVLDLDPAELPTTPYMLGDAFAPGLHLFPPVPAQVTVQVVHLPFSDPAQAITYTVSGPANEFGYFQPSGPHFHFEEPGEFRVEISAVFTDTDGTLWAGAVTWGNVVEGEDAQIEAHGRRGMDYKTETIDDMPAWFYNKDLPPEKKTDALENFYPYFSGDIHWGDEQMTCDDCFKGDSIFSTITFKDLTSSGDLYDILRATFPRGGSYHWPPLTTSLEGLNKRIAVGEAPPFITTYSGVDPAVNPADIDLWSYAYGSSERPDVHVHEVVQGNDGMSTVYWRFADTYGYQIGEPAQGDEPGDIKWEFGGMVFRYADQEINEYAIYSSLWVLLPEDDPLGARVTAPFQDALGAGVNGGPILTLRGEGIDMLFLPKGVRPGNVLEVGDTVSFSGHVGPPLNSRVDVTITSPSGVPHTRSWHANKIGWIYDPTFNLVADEPGRWTVDVRVTHDRPYLPTGTIPQSHNTGTVLGTSGRYEFYVVAQGSPRLGLTSPQAGFLDWAAPNTPGRIQPIPITGVAPAGTSAIHYTIHDKGIVMGQGTLAPGPDGAFTLTYDPVTLHDTFSMLSLIAHEGRWEGLADEVTISLLAVGSGEPRAATVTLIGEEVFMTTGQAETWSTVYLPLILRLH